MCIEQCFMYEKMGTDWHPHDVKKNYLRECVPDFDRSKLLSTRTCKSRNFHTVQNTGMLCMSLKLYRSSVSFHLTVWIITSREPNPDARLALTCPDGNAKIGDNAVTKEPDSVVDLLETSTVMQNDETSFFKTCLTPSASRCREYNPEHKLYKVNF